MATVTGYVDHIIYQNEENGYTVLELVQDGNTITVTGNLGRISEGESLRAEGRFVVHPSYGEQFQVISYELTEPEDLLSIERYLGSGAIKGIGQAMAARIVKKFKFDTMRILDEEPERLAEIKGISERGARAIAEQAAEKRELRQAMMFLQQYGISLALAVKIYDKYGPELYSMVQTNPYRMADDIPGVGFKVADEIAGRTGIAADSDFRIRSGIYYTLLNAVGAGHVYLPETVLYNKAAELMDVDTESMGKHLMDLILEKKVISREVDGEMAIYAAPYFYMEQNVAGKLLDLDLSYAVDRATVDGVLQELEQRRGLEPDEVQRRAIETALGHGVTVITGGPGTGKTTTINAIIRVLEEEGMQVALAAPTGRAAKRMAETTGHEAKTIHRLLEFTGSPEEDGERSAVFFEKNESNPLEADAVIIDEMSMVDIFLMNSLLKAISVGTRLILVGDAGQLPSVGPGNVLRDIIESGCFAVVELLRIFRQEEAGDIVVNAHVIHDGGQVDVNRSSRDFLFIKRNDPGHVIGAAITLLRDKLPGYVNAASADIQVLTPMRKGILGVENLNNELQRALNPAAPEKREKQFPQGIFREGDKIMQIKNNYQLEWEQKNRFGVVVDKGAGVFNGDMGVIRGINLFAEELTVEYDEGRLVNYPFSKAEELELAYAVTVHKSQGSEYPAVVIPLLTGPRMLMNRNLIYTAVTRAKRCVCIVGLPETFLAMVENDEEQRRFSGLSCFIREMQRGDLHAQFDF